MGLVFFQKMNLGDADSLWFLIAEPWRQPSRCK
jgi:hypothetical protein